jgi:hypothetical protein
MGPFVGLSQTSATLVLLHENGHILGGCIILTYDVTPHTQWFIWSQAHRGSHIYDATSWQLLHMTTFDSLNSPTKISYNYLRTNHDHFSEIFGHGYILFILGGCKQTCSTKKLREKDRSMAYIAVVLRVGINHALKPVHSRSHNLPRIPLIGRKSRTRKTLYLVPNPIRGRAMPLWQVTRRVFLYGILVPASCGADVTQRCRSVTRMRWIRT